MKHGKRRFALLIVLLGIFWIVGGGEPKSAYACVFPKVSVQSILEDSNVIAVVGKFIETDITARNGIFKVEQYLTGGSGAEYIMISNAPTSLLDAWSGGVDVGCATTGDFLPTDIDMVVFAYQKDDGTYDTFNGSLYMYVNPDDPVEVYVSFESRIAVMDNLSLSELVELVGNISGEQPQNPANDQPYPLGAPLLITTDQNSAYMLPVDGTDPILLMEDFYSYQVSGNYILFVKDDSAQVIPTSWIFNYDGERIIWETPLSDCPRQDCARISPHGVFTANFTPGDRLLVKTFSANEYNDENFIADMNLDPLPDYVTEFAAPVFGYGFSPNDGLLAVWKESSIGVYTLSIDWDNIIKKTKINEIEIVPGQIFSGTWSNDARQLAFTDAEGVWVWNVFSDEKQLVIADMDAIPMLFSPNDNYLQVQKNSDAVYIDLVTGEQYPAGFMSPNEDLLAVPPSEDLQLGQVCNLIIGECMTPPWYIAEVIWLNSRGTLIWSFNYDIGLPGYGGGNPAHFDLYHELCFQGDATYFPPQDQRDNLPWYYGIGFDFEPTSQQVLIQNDEQTLSIGYELISWNNTAIYSPYREISEAVCNNFVTFDLAGMLDGDIVSVEWLPSIYYPE